MSRPVIRREQPSGAAGHTRRTLLQRGLQAGAVVAAASLAACGRPGAATPAAQAQGEVTAWVFPLTQTDNEVIWGPLMRRFQQEQPRVTPRVEVLPWSGRLEKMLAAVSGGSPPEIAYLNLDFIAKFADVGALTPLDTVLTDATKKSYHAEVARKIRYKGKIAIAPILMSIYIPFYNADMAQRAGLSVDKAPVTWKDLEEWAARLHRPERGEVAISHNWDAETSTGHMYNWIWQAGGELIQEPDGKKALFNSPQAVTALEFVLSLFERQYIPEECKQGKGPGFGSGAVGVALYGSNNTPVALKKDAPNLRYLVGHVLQGTKRLEYGTLAGYAIFKDGQNQAAAQEWIRFMQRPESMGELLKQSGYMPPVDSLKAADLYPGDEPRQRMVEEAQYVHLDPIHPFSREMSRLLAEQSQKALLKQVQPKQALDAAAAQLEALITR
jgi:multiple sugar transport system substrate-binding protein